MLDGAKFCRVVANRLERAWLEYQAEPLTITEAAQLRGEHYTTTYRKVKAGKLPNVGTEHHPRVRRRDLFKTHRDGPDLASEILCN
jgi:excisionase family DNA binding protein